jgi:hypothetical protein
VAPLSCARLRWIRACVLLGAMTVSAMAASCGSNPRGGAGAGGNVKTAPRLVYFRAIAGQVGHDREIGTVRIDGTDRRPVLSVSGQSADPRVQTSPSGRYLVIASSGSMTVRPRIVLADLSAGRQLATIDTQYGLDFSTGGLPISWAPGEATFAYRDEHEAHLVDVATGQVATPAGLTAVFNDLRWSDDGRYLAGCSLVQPQVWSSSGARMASVRDPAGRSPSCNQWGWDENTLIFDPVGQPELYALDPATGRMTRRFAPPNSAGTDFSIRNKDLGQKNCLYFEHVRLIATAGSGRWALGNHEQWIRLDTDPPCDRVMSVSRRRWAALGGDGRLTTALVGNDQGKDFGTPVQLNFSGPAVVRNFVFTRDERHLIFQTGEPLSETGDGLFFAAVDGSGTRKIADAVGALHLSASGDGYGWVYSAAADRLIAIRADQYSLIVTDGTLAHRRTISFPSGGQLLAPPRLRLSPDGRYALLESGSAAGDMVIDLASGQRYDLPPADGIAQVFWPAELATPQHTS